MFLTGCQTKSQKSATDATTNLTNVETSGAKFGLGEAEKNLPAASNFFQSLLSGNWNDVMKVIQPEADSLTAQYTQATKSAEEFAPRGGGRTATLANLPYEKANALSQLVGQARSGAATSLAQIGEAEFGESTGAAGTGLSGSSQLSADANQQVEQQQQAGESAGALIALLAGI